MPLLNIIPTPVGQPVPATKTAGVSPDTPVENESPKMYVKRLRLAELQPTQNGLKRRTRKDVEKLAKSLQENETQYPLFVALIGDAYRLIDGHFRHHVMKSLYGVSHVVEVIVFEGLTLDQAKKQCLVLSARYGDMANIEEWIKTELPTYEIDLVALGFAPEKEATPFAREEESCICPACGKSMKPGMKTKEFKF